MSKKGKAKNRLRRAMRDQRDALSDLTLCARLVGDLLGHESQCFQAAALMIATARELGHELEPRLVSALGVSNGRSPGFVTGAVAAEAAAAAGLPAVEDDPDGNYARDWAGHAVVLLRDPPTLFDANFRQFTRAGFPPISLVMTVIDGVPTAGLWQGSLTADLKVCYIPDDRDADKHLATIERLTRKYGVAGGLLADMVRAGIEPDDTTWVPTFIAKHAALGQQQA